LYLPLYEINNARSRTVDDDVQDRHAARVRWQALFDDLEAQAEQLAAAELQAEVTDRTRREYALLRLVDRLRETEGHPLAVSVWGAGVVHGRLACVRCLCRWPPSWE
jgi:hypothetical protein